MVRECMYQVHWTHLSQTRQMQGMPGAGGWDGMEVGPETGAHVFG